MKQRLFIAVFALFSGSLLSAYEYSADIVVGQASQDFSSSGFSGSDENASLGARFAFFIDKNMSLEIGYQYYGEAKDSSSDGAGGSVNSKFKTSAVNLGGKGILPLDYGVSLIGRAGLAYWDAEAELTATAFPGVVATADDNGLDFYYGVGVELQVNSNTYIGLEYTRLDFDASDSGVKADVETENLALSLGVYY